MSFPNLSAAIEGYLITKSAKGLSPNTLRNYRVDLERFAQWVHDPPVDTITSRQIERYFQYLNEEFRIVSYGTHQVKTSKKLSAKSVQNAWSALNNFWKWIETEFGVSNPFSVPYIKANTKPVDPVPQDEVERLLKACDYAVRQNGGTRYRTKRPTAKRDKAIILLMVNTASEFLNRAA